MFKIMKILVLDNYDSFTYNLVHYIEKVTGVLPDVFRNDKITVDDAGKYDKILLSPGPGIPVEAGILLDLIKKLAPEKDIFGVCLGLQAIGEAFGGKLINLNKVYHGIATPVEVVKEDVLFNNIPKKFLAGRYHSWVLDPENTGNDIVVTAIDEQKNVMAIKHKNYNVRAVQFHPESILTENGIEIIKNWIHNAYN